MTLGPGTWGGSIISDNVSAKHLMNFKRLAYETKPLNPPTGAPRAKKDETRQAPTGTASFGTGLSAEDVDRIAAEFNRSLK